MLGVRLLDQFLVGPGVDRPAALEVDVRAEDASEPRPPGASSILDPGSGASETPVVREELRELRPEGVLSVPAYDRPAKRRRPDPLATVGGVERARTPARRGPWPGRACSTSVQGGARRSAEQRCRPDSRGAPAGPGSRGGRLAHVEVAGRPPG